MRVLRAMWALVSRWYVAAVILVVLGIAVGNYLFLNVGPGRPQIGIIDIPFTVIDSPPFGDSAFVIGQMIDYAQSTDSIKAVVIKLVTPGGSASDSEELYHKLVSLREEKPVIVSSGWLNASGGMLMSMGANYIYTEAGSEVGNIGVVGSLPFQRRPDEGLIITGPAKLTGGSERTETGKVELLKEAFIQTVVSERGDRLRIGPAEIAEARLYQGMEAVRLGLMDEIGSYTDAIEKAASLAGISNYELVDVNEKVQRQFVEQFLRIFAPLDTRADVTAFELWDSGRLRNITSASEGGESQTGLPLGSPIEASLPRMYYLYVPPTE